MAVQKHSVTILSGQTQSTSVQIGKDQAIVRLDVPSMTSTSVSFQVSDDNTTFLPVRDDTGVLFSVTVSGASAIQIPIEKIISPNYLKIVGSTVEISDKVIQIYHLEV